MSILDLGDIVQTLRVMTEEEARQWGIPLDERHNYVCLETLKHPDFPSPQAVTDA
jgi:hypothetical protein